MLHLSVADVFVARREALDIDAAALNNRRRNHRFGVNLCIGHRDSPSFARPRAVPASPRVTPHRVPFRDYACLAEGRVSSFGGRAVFGCRIIRAATRTPIQRDLRRLAGMTCPGKCSERPMPVDRNRRPRPAATRSTMPARPRRPVRAAATPTDGSGRVHRDLRRYRRATPASPRAVSVRVAGSGTVAAAATWPMTSVVPLGVTCCAN